MIRILQALLSLIFLALFATPAAAQPRAQTDQRLLFVMLDGLRWQEVFHGADPALAAQTEYMRSPWAASARRRFVDAPDRRAALTPFLTNVIAREGALIGDRDHGSCARVTNSMWFSYPGYNEALTGKADPQINSNDFGPNPNVTFLEWLNRRPDFRGRVRAVTSWDAFPRIINAERSGVPVNAGFAAAEESGETGVRMLNRLLADTAHPFDIVRLDSFTHQIALDALNRHAPRALFISYGETDDFAHEGDYAQYLISANRTDRFLREIWEMLQRYRRYAGRTTMIVTVDHGRGDRADASWRHHSSGEALRVQYPDGIPGSDQTWVAAIGPRVRAGETLTAQSSCAGLNQVASTALSALGIDWRTFDPEAGAPLPILLPESAH